MQNFLASYLDAQFAVFADRFLAYFATGLADLPEYNLDTGVVEGQEPIYPLARSTQLKVQELRSLVGAADLGQKVRNEPDD